MKSVSRHSSREPTIALINIVFLMLVFFMVAGTLAQPLDQDLKLIRTSELEGRAPPDALVVHSDGSMKYGLETIENAAEFMKLGILDPKRIRLIPDRDLPAEKLVALVRGLRAAGAEKVLIVTERGLE